MWVSNSVADTGMGIAENRLSRVVEAFTQVESGLSRDYSRLLGGDLHIESELAKATRVPIVFPASYRGSFEESGYTSLMSNRGDWKLNVS